MKAQRELLASEDVKFGVPHRQKDYSATNPTFLEEWQFLGWWCSSGARSKGHVCSSCHTTGWVKPLVNQTPLTQSLILQLWPWCASHPRVSVKAFLLTFTVFPPPFLNIFFQCNEDLASFSLRLRQNKMKINPNYAIVSLNSMQPDRAKFSDPE